MSGDNSKSGGRIGHNVRAPRLCRPDNPARPQNGNRVAHGLVAHSVLFRHRAFSGQAHHDLSGVNASLYVIGNLYVRVILAKRIYATCRHETQATAGYGAIITALATLAMVALIDVRY
jgi:hypothetical protein